MGPLVLNGQFQILNNLFVNCFFPPHFCLSLADYEVVTIKATDADDPKTFNAEIRYRIMSQEPMLPSANLFAINSVNGVIRYNGNGLDREVRL